MNENFNTPGIQENIPVQKAPPPFTGATPDYYTHLKQQNAEKEAIKANAAAFIGSKWAKLMILLCFALSVFFAETVICSRLSLGVGLFCIALEGVALLFAKMDNKPVNKPALLLFVPIFLITAGFSLFRSPSTEFIRMLVVTVLFAVQFLYICFPEKKNLLSISNIREVAASLIIDPINMFPVPFKTLAATKRGQGNSKLWQITAGVVISIPIIFVFLFLFATGDNNYGNMVEGFLEYVFSSIGNIVIDVFLGAFVFLYLAPYMVSIKTREIKNRKTEIIKTEIPTTVLFTVLTAVSAVVLSFVCLQFSYLFSESFSSFSASQISSAAREGFFSLSWASFILFALVALVISISKKANGQMHLSLRIPMLCLCLCNLIVLTSAVIRMYCYIDSFGFSRKRILTMWFMGIIAVSTCLLIIKILNIRFNAVGCIAAAAIAFTCALSFINIDKIIALDHVSRYMDGRAAYLEDDFLGKLSYSALPALIEVYEFEKNPENKDMLKDLISMRDSEMKSGGFAGFTFDSLSISKKIEYSGVPVI